jgi:hypothetical protein
MATKYASELSVGSVFTVSRINNLSNYLYSEGEDNGMYMADALMYINMAGVVILFIHTIFLRRNLVRMSVAMDQDQVSPSDFALIVRGVPLDMTKERLKEVVEAKFSQG